jgi:protein kinase-like protein
MTAVGVAQLRAGDHVGRYRIVALLGRGGMGTVYHAVDEQLGRQVALKILSPDVGQGGGDPQVRADAARRMVREARTGVAFVHPNAVTVYDIGEIDGAPFIAMELVRGRLLRALVADATVALDDRLRWLGDVARVLAAAHRAGLVHRDVKPDNVIVGDDGVVKLLDFGVVRRVALPEGTPPASHDGTITVDGALVGTPAYMPPEQLRGERVDGRADQFSWAVMAYELIAGKKPWTALSAPVLIAAIIGREPEWLTAPGLSRPVAETVMRALSKAADDRFASMDALLEALAGRTQAARRPPLLSRRARQRLRAARAPLALVLLFAGAALGAWWITRLPEPEPPAATPTAAREVAVPVASASATGAASAMATATGSASPLATTTGSASPTATAAGSAPPPATTTGSASPTAAATGAAVPAAAATAALPAEAATGAALPAAAASGAAAVPRRYPCPPAGRHDDAAPPCAAGLRGWCDPDGRALACCAPGLVATGRDGGCACPAGGSPERPDCARPSAAADYEARVTSAIRRAYLGCRPPDADRLDLALDLWIDPDGHTFDARILEAYSADARLQRCAIDHLQKLAVEPPPGGFARLAYGRR